MQEAGTEPGDVHSVGESITEGETEEELGGKQVKSHFRDKVFQEKGLQKNI